MTERKECGWKEFEGGVRIVAAPCHLPPFFTGQMEAVVKILKMNEIPKNPYVNPLFTGPNVTSQNIISDSKDLRLSIVNFGKGVRNKFHAHDGDQVLIISGGKGFVATEKEKKTVIPGEIVFFPAGEKHWHGATPDSEFSHIVITKAGTKFTQLED